MPRCRLCGEFKEKLCKAHTLPEAFYRFIKLDDEPLMSIPGSEKYPYTQTHIGRWDDEILCSDCDQSILGKLDDYAARVFLQREFSVHWFQNPQSTHFCLKDVDLARIKLFWVSILWRHAISGLPEHENVSLPEEDVDNIRRMLREGTPGAPEDYSVALIYFGSPQVIIGLSESPFGENWFEIYACGWHVLIKGSRSRDKHEFRPLYIEPGTDPIVIVRDFDDAPQMLDVVARFVLLDKSEANRAHANYRRQMMTQVEESSNSHPRSPKE